MTAIMSDSKSPTSPRLNAAKVGKILRDREGYADLYRTAMAGPSGQTAHTFVGRVEYTYTGSYEVTIRNADGKLVGYALRTARDGRAVWSITAHSEYTGYSLFGYASSLSIGCDALVNGEFAVSGRNTMTRRTGGYFHRYSPAS